MEVAVLALVPILAVVAAVTWVLWQVLRGLKFLVVGLVTGIAKGSGRVFGFLRSELVEILQTAGAGLTLAALLPMTVINFAIGRWSTARHYAKAMEDEFVSGALGIYRIALAHPLRLVGLGQLLEGVERRIPDVVDRAPRRPRTAKDALDFPGYDVVGTLPAGGSGAQLYLARPRKDTFERFRNRGQEVAGEVVIKSFDLVQGSTLPQIVRESRALEAANRLGLVYEHHLDEDRFFYVMRYERGDNLDTVIQRLHARASSEGLGQRELTLVLGYGQDLLRSLDRFHTGGLWHKDVKPANVIISGDEAHLVDFGLVTPLQSALTLTTHGTEYYRDPEMVRLAMQGVKVHEVDGVKFDLYSAGAVLFSMIEDSFPAHGSLSRVTKRCPEALVWIIRRSMADIGSRYTSAWEMLDDLTALAEVRDPFAMLPADLPSVRRGDAPPRPRPTESQPARGLGARVAALFPGAATGASATENKRPPSLPREEVRPITTAGRSRRRRVFAAALLVTLSFAAIGSILEDRNSHSPRAQVWQDGGMGSVSAGGYSSAGVLPATRYSDSERSALQEAMDLVNLRRSQSPLRTKAPEAVGTLTEQRALAGGRLYLLDDPFHPAAPEILKRTRETLEARGFQLVDSRDLGLSAEVRMQVGSNSLGDAVALERLQGYLNQSSEVDAILWLASGEKDEEAVYEFLISQDLKGRPTHQND